jgi:hypothetical protein
MTASDNAVFIIDLVEQGCEWHLAHGHLFLCRKNGEEWENVLAYKIIHYPKREVPEGGSPTAISTKIWIEPSEWTARNLSPNLTAEEGLKIFNVVAAASRFQGHDNKEELWAELAKRCSGKTHKQILEI